MDKLKTLIGRVEKLDFPEFALFNIEAKIDTGAYTAAIHCSRLKLVKEGAITYISFHIPGSKIHGVGKKEFRTADFKQKNIKNSFGHIESRYVIKTKIRIFNKLITTEFSLTDRSEMKYPVLLGRKLLAKRFIVDVSTKNLSFKNKKKTK